MTLVLIGGGFMLCMILIVILLAFIAFPVLKKVVGGLIVATAVFIGLGYVIGQFYEARSDHGFKVVQPGAAGVVTDVTDTALFVRESETRSQPAPIPLPRPRPNRQ